MKNSSIGKIYLETSLFELCTETVEKKDVAIKEEKIKEMKKEEIEVKNNYKPISSNFKNIRVNNTFVEANKKSLTEIKNRWDKLNDHTFDKENGAIVCELLDATPTAASNSYLILTYNYDSFVEKGNMYIEKYEKVLQDILDLSHKLVFLTNEEWNKNKNEYIENIKNNVKYNYIDEESQVQEEVMDDFESVENKTSEIIEKANQLFDMSKIEIKGE